VAQRAAQLAEAGWRLAAEVARLGAVGFVTYFVLVDLSTLIVPLLVLLLVSRLVLAFYGNDLLIEQ
jgi:hypothetical protein